MSVEYNQSLRSLSSQKFDLTPAGRKKSFNHNQGSQGSIPELLAQNKAWASEVVKRRPGFFETLSKQQNPKYLWIGCSDSRVPANEIVGLLPGELFVHRNVANVIVHTDLNCLTVLQYAVDILKVEHIIICGHYGCGGVQAALEGRRVGLADNWIRHIKDVNTRHALAMASTPQQDRLDVLCELNVIEQALNVSQTTVVQDAWFRGQPLRVHSWIYGLKNGHLKDLGMSVNNNADIEETYDAVLSRFQNNQREDEKDGGDSKS